MECVDTECQEEAVYIIALGRVKTGFCYDHKEHFFKAFNNLKRGLSCQKH